MTMTTPVLLDHDTNMDDASSVRQILFATHSNDITLILDQDVESEGSSSGIKTRKFESEESSSGIKTRKVQLVKQQNYVTRQEMEALFIQVRTADQQIRNANQHIAALEKQGECSAVCRSCK